LFRWNDFNNIKEDIMTIRRLALFSAFLVSTLSLPFTAMAAEQTGKKAPADYSVSLGVDYSNGDYGTSITTDAVATKLTLGWLPTDRLDFSLEIPYLYQSNSSTTPFGMGRFRTSRMQQGGLMQGPMRSGSSQFASTFDVSRSQSGIGDLILRGGYIVVPESNNIPQIRPEAYVKFPTADENKGLGTGEFDGGIGVTLTKWFGDWNGSFEGVYNFIGKSADFNLNNYFSYEADLGYQLTDRFMPALALKGATSPSSDSSAYFEMRIKALYKITGRLGADGYLGKGFTDGTPDYTAGAELSYMF
jgi:hypothetical protein